MNNIVVEKAQSVQEINDALNVRYQVFVIEQKIDPDLQHDSWDDNCDHFVAYLDNKPVGAGRVRYINSNTAKIERMAVLSEFRGNNIGGRLLEKITNSLRTSNIDKATLNSQFHAKGFYEKFGFKQTGEIFQEANIDHIKMEKFL